MGMSSTLTLMPSVSANYLGILSDRTLRSMVEQRLARAAISTDSSSGLQQLRLSVNALEFPDDWVYLTTLKIYRMGVYQGAKDTVADHGKIWSAYRIVREPKSRASVFASALDVLMNSLIGDFRKANELSERASTAQSGPNRTSQPPAPSGRPARSTTSEERIVTAFGAVPATPQGAQPARPNAAPNTPASLPAQTQIAVSDVPRLKAAGGTSVVVTGTVARVQRTPSFPGSDDYSISLYFAESSQVFAYVVSAFSKSLDQRLGGDRIVGQRVSIRFDPLYLSPGEPLELRLLRPDDLTVVRR
jgi:hypothetical protein